MKPGFSLFDERNDLRKFIYQHTQAFPFEHLGQKSGFVIYDKLLDEKKEGIFTAPHLRDRALVYINEVGV